MGINPYAKYQKTQIETADQGKLLLMLYDGALRFLGLARQALLEKDLEAANNKLVRVQDIVAELMASLDLESGEVAVSLFRLYEYMHYLLVQANIQKDAEPLKQVESMLVELRNTWKEVLVPAQISVSEKEEGISSTGKTGVSSTGEDQAVSYATYNEGQREGEILQRGYKKVNISG